MEMKHILSILILLGFISVTSAEEYFLQCEYVSGSHNANDKFANYWSEQINILAEEASIEPHTIWMVPSENYLHFNSTENISFHQQGVDALFTLYYIDSDTGDVYLDRQTNYELNGVTGQLIEKEVLNEALGKVAGLKDNLKIKDKEIQEWEKLNKPLKKLKKK